MSNRPIANHDTPDPWLLASPLQPHLFYLTFTLGNRIELWSSSNLEDFTDQNPSLKKSCIWRPSPGSPWSADIWAPELHFLFGTWYIYAAGAQPGQGNPSHRTIVLRNTNPTRDPMDPESWVFEGPLKGLPRHQWSIDATVFSPDPGLSANMAEGLGGYPDEQRRWYICYSGWPLGDNSDTQQDLFLARMRGPMEADEQSLVCVSRAELEWERPDGGKRGVNEGPSWVDFGRGGWKGIVYSGHGSWTCEYKLGLLQFVGGPQDDLCNERLWRKRMTPLLVSDRNMGGPFGPGHASFVSSSQKDGGVFCVYHATERDNEGWNNRKGRVICMGQDCFHDNARTMCCSYSVCGPARDTHGVFPGQPMQANQSQIHNHGQSQYSGQNQSVFPGQVPAGQSQQGGGRSNFDKYAGEIEKRIPVQYQGYFNKAKKFLNK